MLLTLPWFGSLILGRVDLVHGVGVDKQTSKFSIKSLWKQVSAVPQDVCVCVGGGTVMTWSCLCRGYHSFLM